jgi:hypothetical protein
MKYSHLGTVGLGRFMGLESVSRPRFLSLLILFIAVAVSSPGCNSPVAINGSEQTGSAALALPGPGQLVNAPLTLQVLTNSCGSNQMQDVFEITNTGTTPINLSDISIKFWAYDTSGSAVVPHVWAGGCVTNVNGNPSCVYQVAGASATAAMFSPACGPDSTHQANWEITISTTDGGTLPPGAIWSNLQSALNLANYSNFSPGTADWFTPCLPGTTYAMDAHFAVYFQGNLVVSQQGITAPSCRAPHGSQQLVGYLGNPATAPLVGNVPPSTTVNLAIGLPASTPPGGPALPDAVRAVSDPFSPTYRQYISRPTFDATYGAPAADYQSLVAWAQAHGLSITATHSNNLLLEVNGTAAAVEQALYTNLTYRGRPDGSTFITVDRDPSLDLTVPILHISGLGEFVSPGPKMPGQNGSGSGNRYWGWDYRNAYLGTQASECTQLDGSGQVVGVLGANCLFDPADIAAYEAQAMPVALEPAPLTIAPIPTPILVNFTGAFKQARFFEECTGDVSVVHAMAPGATVQLFAGDSGFGSMDGVLAAMAESNITVGTSSFTWTPSANAQQLLQEMAMRGIAFFDASGDNGAEIPADERILDDLTQVGGTFLLANPVGSVGYYSSEATWPSSGGGIMSGSSSSCWVGCNSPTPIPWWQTNTSMATNNGSTLYRNFPDVSAVAFNHVFIWQGSSLFRNGTSLSAPIWAGFTALANQFGLLQSPRFQPVGFVNPVLYAIGNTETFSGIDNVYTNTFADIKDQGFNNGNGQAQIAAFQSVPGYDLATGWGTPTCSLLVQLATHNPAVAPPGGVFPPAQLNRTVQVTNSLNPPGGANPFVVDGLWPLSNSLKENPVVNVACNVSPSNPTVSQHFVDCSVGENGTVLTVDLSCELLKNAANLFTPDVQVTLAVSIANNCQSPEPGSQVSSQVSFHLAAAESTAQPFSLQTPNLNGDVALTDGSLLVTNTP